jgi:hypothetical protein
VAFHDPNSVPQEPSLPRIVFDGGLIRGPRNQEVIRDLNEPVERQVGGWLFGDRGRQLRRPFAQTSYAMTTAARRSTRASSRVKRIQSSCCRVVPGRLNSGRGNGYWGRRKATHSTYCATISDLFRRACDSYDSIPNLPRQNGRCRIQKGSLGVTGGSGVKEIGRKA